MTTAYKEYALEGYELDVTDYLLKPFSFPRFLKAINKVNATEKAGSLEAPKINSVENHRFFLKGDKKYHQINTRDILFVEAFGNYSKIYLREEMILCHEKISSLENVLASEHFLRVHKSFLVATDKIKLIQGNRIYLQDHEIPIGQTYRSRINHLLSGKS